MTNLPPAMSWSLSIQAVGAIVLDLVGRVFATGHCLARDDLSGKQTVVYLLVVWIVPYIWIVYLLLGKERTAQFLS